MPFLRLLCSLIFVSSACATLLPQTSVTNLTLPYSQSCNFNPSLAQLSQQACRRGFNGIKRREDANIPHIWSTDARDATWGVRGCLQRLKRNEQNIPPRIRPPTEDTFSWADIANAAEEMMYRCARLGEGVFRGGQTTVGPLNLFTLILFVGIPAGETYRGEALIA